MVGRMRPAMVEIGRILCYVSGAASILRSWADLCKTT